MTRYHILGFPDLVLPNLDPLPWRAGRTVAIPQRPFRPAYLFIAPCFGLVVRSITVGHSVVSFVARADGGVPASIFQIRPEAMPELRDGRLEIDFDDRYQHPIPLECGELAHPGMEVGVEIDWAPRRAAHAASAAARKDPRRESALAPDASSTVSVVMFGIGE